MINNLRSSWLLNKFSFSTIQELYKTTVWRICILMLGCKGLKVCFLCKYVLLQMGLKFWSKNKIKKKPANLFSARVLRLLTWRLAIVPFADKTQIILTSCSWLLTVNNPCPTAGRRENVKKQRGTMWDHGKMYSLSHPLFTPTVRKFIALHLEFSIPYRGGGLEQFKPKTKYSNYTIFTPLSTFSHLRSCNDKNFKLLHYIINCKLSSYKWQCFVELLER